MAYYIVKIVVTTALVVAGSELSKRSGTLGALLASIPLVSFLSITWLYVETGNTAKVADLARAFSGWYCRRCRSFSCCLTCSDVA